MERKRLRPAYAIGRSGNQLDVNTNKPNVAVLQLNQTCLTCQEEEVLLSISMCGRGLAFFVCLFVYSLKTMSVETCSIFPSFYNYIYFIMSDKLYPAYKNTIRLPVFN